MKTFVTLVALIWLSTLHSLAERINQEGRILGSLPVVTNAIVHG